MTVVHVNAGAHPQAADFGQQVLLGHLHILHDDHPGDRGPQGELALDLGRGQALHAALKDEAAHLPVVALGPDNGHVCLRGVGDPGGTISSFNIVMEFDGFIFPHTPLTPSKHCTARQRMTEGVADGWGSCLCRGIRQPSPSIRDLIG